MLISQILLATLAAGIGSVWLAAFLSYFALSRFNQHLLSLAAGALLSTAFMNLLPEAFEAAAKLSIEPHALFTALLAGLVFFFLLDKAELYHHGHEHRHDDHPHDHHSHEHSHAQTAHSHIPHGGSWAVLFGDSIHSFGDGVVIAAAFMVSPQLGWAAALAVLAHEVPHHMGDLIVVGQGKRGAVLKVTLAGTVTALGGLAGYWLLAQLGEYLPYFLVVAGSSFIYVALADLIPQLQRRMSFAETLKQVAWLLLGMALVALVTHISH